MDKYHRTTYRRPSLTISQNLFGLVHCDIWDLARVSFVSGHRYYIVFVDDYSRVSWVYLLIDRLRVLDTVKHFFAEIINQYSVIPKISCIDNALEFIQTHLQHYRNSSGILHKTFTTSYLVNRMLFAPFGGETPLRRLRPNIELFSLPPKIFGCVTFVKNLTPDLDKLSPCSLKCVFVGYSQTEKGYDCYHPLTRRYIVSVDVTFFDSQPFFDSTTSSCEGVPLSIPIEESVSVEDKPVIMKHNLPRPL